MTSQAKSVDARDADALVDRQALAAHPRNRLGLFTPCSCSHDSTRL